MFLFIMAGTVIVATMVSTVVTVVAVAVAADDNRLNRSNQLMENVNPFSGAPEARGYRPAASGRG